MNEASIERLREYLAQLPPQSQALLMREFERALERGEDTAVASFVLEILRRGVRGSAEDDEYAPPRTEDPARLVFRSLEPFLVDGNFPIRPGQIRRASLAPVWLWLERDGASEAVREFEQALADARETEASVEPAVRKLQLAAAQAIANVATPAQGDDRQRALSRIGAPNVVEDLVVIRSVLQAREALETFIGKLPDHLRMFGESQVAATATSLNVLSLQTPQDLPFA